jgi:hypothetical protein
LIGLSSFVLEAGKWRLKGSQKWLKGSHCNSASRIESRKVDGRFHSQVAGPAAVSDRVAPNRLGKCSIASARHGAGPSQRCESDARRKPPPDDDDDDEASDGRSRWLRSLQDAWRAPAPNLTHGLRSPGARPSMGDAVSAGPQAKRDQIWREYAAGLGKRMEESRTGAELAGSGSMRGVQVEVPPSATARLTELSLNRDLALESSRACQQKINLLPDDAPSQMLARLRTERDKQAANNNTLHRLLSACNQYLFQLRLPPGYYLKPLSVSVTLAKGQTAAEAIDAVRHEIAGINQQILAVRRAPLKQQSRQTAIHRALASMALAARPKLNFDQHGNASFVWREDLASMNDMVGILALMFPSELVNAFQLGDEPDQPNAISPEERENKLSELSLALLSAERRESALLDKADGVLVRPDMSPAAFLQIEVVAQEAQAAVA